MPYYWCQASSITDLDLPKCNLFRKKSRGLCRTCYDKLNDQEYAKYKLWWEANYETCNRADEGPTITLRENSKEMTGMTSAGSAGPSVKKQRTNYEKDQGKDQGKDKGKARIRAEDDARRSTPSARTRARTRPG